MSHLGLGPPLSHSIERAMTFCPFPKTELPLDTARWNSISPPSWQTLTTLGLPIGLVLMLIGLQQNLDINLFTPEGFQTAAAKFGAWGPALYIGLLAISVVISQIPGAPLAIAAGAVWGPLNAGIYTVLGGFLGALIAYSLGKTFGQSLLKLLTGKTIQFSKERGETYLGGLIFLMRLVPVFSFDLISYGAGITGLSLPVYASATLLGMVPSTFLLTYLGGAFHLGTTGIVAIVSLLIAGVIILPWGIKRHHWFDLQDVIQVS